MSYYNNGSSPNFFTSAFESNWDDTQEDAKYDEDASKYLFDSPQPESQQLPPRLNTNPSNSTPQNVGYYTTPSHLSPAAENSKRQAPQSIQPSSNLSQPPTNFTMASSSSDGSEQSSPSNASSAQQRKRKVSSASTPPDLLAENLLMDDDAPSNAYKMENAYADDGMYGYDTTFPAMGQASESMVLNTSQAASPNMDYRGAADSPEYSGGFGSSQRQDFANRNFASLNNFQSANASPHMTIQPSKTTFMLNQSRETSPMIGSHESSPGAFLNTGSPFNGGNDVLGSGFPSLSSNGLHSASPMKMEIRSPADSATAASKEGERKLDHGAKWPCRLTVGETPDKSRVETQIPIELTLYNAPVGVDKIHLPAHTISKPKFQCKPPHEQSSDTLELSAMLVCASAMEKEGLEAKAFERAAADDIFIESEENQPASMKGQSDDNDPCKPLNGGPVAICSGCITRERKRAARKKTKKQDEEEEWAKDEAKRVIVFNCAEVRDWCVPDSKDIPVKDYDGVRVNSMYMKAPMRIACYCRHQSEKVGFQVIFTIRTAAGEILAQAISKSIMITDDHKQPTANQHSSAMFQQGIVGGQMFQNGGYHQSMYNGDLHQSLPFRTSYSTNDLTMFNRNHYNPQRHPPPFSRQTSGYASTGVSTATATPRNLSRPASPTNESAPSSKKRRAGSGHSKVPSGLTMTRVDTFSPTSAPQHPGAPNGGQLPSNYGFASHGYGSAGNFQPHSPSNTFSSGPSTPLHGSMQGPGFATPADGSDAFTFFSAPTSQHASRAPSPASTVRAQAFNNNVQQAEQAPNALARLPPGFNLSRPPIIQKVIPNYGHVNGGEDVTILGTGFFQGLEVMFGDTPCESSSYWADTTLVCKAPPSVDERQVAVVFKHQHRNYSKDLIQLRTIMPTTQVLYTYLDDDRQQMQQLAMGMGNQSLGR